jgi:hypothetical protein
MDMVTRDMKTPLDLGGAPLHEQDLCLCPKGSLAFGLGPLWNFYAHPPDKEGLGLGPGPRPAGSVLLSEFISRAASPATLFAC